ncbi:MAG: helix-turn-helix domain-containing protein [Solirubrobacterales bacterium]
MNNSESISIVLSPAQVDQVVRAAARGTTPGFSTLISSKLKLSHATTNGAAGEPAPSAGGGYLPVSEDTRLSRSLLRGLSILTCFGADNRERGIIEMASQLGMSPSTTHRYVSTLVELGLLERSPRTRKYRLALAPAGDGGSSTTPKRSGKGSERRVKAKS